MPWEPIARGSRARMSSIGRATSPFRAGAAMPIWT